MLAFPHDIVLLMPELWGATAGRHVGTSWKDHIETHRYRRTYTSPRSDAGARLGADQQIRAEGYPASAHYGGCEFVDIAESWLIDRAKGHCLRCRLQQRAAPRGSQGQQAFSKALLSPADTVLGMSLAHGGTLTQFGASVKTFPARHYQRGCSTASIRYRSDRTMRKSKAMAVSTSLNMTSRVSPPIHRILDFPLFREIAVTKWAPIVC